MYCPGRRWFLPGNNADWRVTFVIRQLRYGIWLCSEFSVNAYPHGKTVHILRSSEPEAEAEPPPMAARSVLDRLA